MQTQDKDLEAWPPRRLPESETAYRVGRCRALLARLHPEAEGLLLSSKTHQLWLTGTAGAGLLWLPLEGEPVLLLRKGSARGRAESSLKHVLPFVSYREIAGLCAEAGSPLGSTIAVDKNAFSWGMADMLKGRIKCAETLAGDDVLSRARAA